MASEWERKFEEGISLFKAARYEEALEMINEVLKLVGSEKMVYDSRAAVLEKLNLPLEALKDSKKVIDLAPDSWQGYARSARLFLQVGRPGPALKMADLALERLKKDAAKRQKMEAIRQQALKELEPPTCHFAKLPAEICSTIFIMIAGGTEARTLALSLVCRSWRSIILDTPALWRRLILSHKTPAKKFHAWLERSKGRIYFLDVLQGFSFTPRPNLFKNIPQPLQWKEIRSLTIFANGMNSNLGSTLPPGAFEQLQLEELSLSYNAIGASLNKFIGNMDMSCMKTLMIQGDNTVKPGTDLPPLKSLKKLSINSAKIVFAETHEFLIGSTAIEELMLVSYIGFEMGTFTPDPVELSSLRRLHLSGRGETWLFFAPGFLQYPNIEILVLDGMRRMWSNMTEQCFSNLQQLTFNACDIEPSVLTAVLRSAKALRTLELSACYPVTAVETIIKALGDMVTSPSDGSIEQVSFICPRLQHLNFRNSPELKSRAITKLVKSRLSSRPILSADNEDPVVPTTQVPELPLPIETLNVENCDSMNPDALPWLRQNVPHFYGRMTLGQKIKRQALRL